MNYHIYQPSFLPPGIEQVLKFYIYDKEFAGSRQAVKTAYDVPIATTVRDGKSGVVIITQAQVSSKFDLEKYLSSLPKGSIKSVTEDITLSNFSGKPVFVQTGGIAKTVYLVTSDNVLIALASAKETRENLILMANSLK